MKKVICYFDHTVKKVLTEKVDENGEKKIVLSSTKNFVYAAEIVARIVDIDDMEDIKTKIDSGYTYYNVIDYKSLKADESIYYDETINAYKAAEYGFVVLDGSRLRLISSITVTKDKLKAYYSIHPTKSGRVPQYNYIEEALHNEHILARLSQKQIEEQLGKIDPKAPKLTRVLVAKGKEPVDGHEEYYIPLIDIKKKAGEIQADGRIDFKEKGSIISVVKDQEILKRIPEVKQVDGYDIYGDKSIAGFADYKDLDGYGRGENIVKSGKDENIFLSSIDGCLDIERRVISILPVVVIHGDVNYETGNIDFNGSVQIRGSVLPGFSVKATGDIIIEKSVDEAYVEADGDITVKRGVVGKETARIVSNGNITAKYLLNAKVEAAGEIVVEDSIINCDVFSNKKISVVAKQGKIIGGKATALYEIIVNVSGSMSETETSLSVGRNLFIEKELEVVQKEISKQREAVVEIMRNLKVSFGEAVFENTKEFISKLPAAQKKKCLLLLKDLSSNNKELKIFTEKSKEIQNKLQLEKEPNIIIKNRAYPGTVISIRKSIKKIDSVIDNVKYYEDPEDKIIRFTPAV